MRHKNFGLLALVLGPILLALASGCASGGRAQVAYQNAPDSDTYVADGIPGGAGDVAFGARVDASRGAKARPTPGPAHPPPPSEDTGAHLYAEAETAEPATTPDGSEGPTADSETASATDTPTAGPLLIYTAELNLAVHEVREHMNEVIAVADDVGGFLASQDQAVVVIRVPASRFRETLNRIEALGDVLNRQIAAQDVSDQVRDIRIRLRNAIQMRDRLAELLERAETVPESLTIERELERLTESIELLRGQLRVLEDRVAYSTITVRFQPIRQDREVPRERFRLPFPWLNDLGLHRLMRL